MINHFRMVHSQHNTMHSYIMLFANEYYNVITLMLLLLLYFNLNFYLKNSHSNAWVSSSKKYFKLLLKRPLILGKVDFYSDIFY
jgi:hypothetical protein